MKLFDILFGKGSCISDIEIDTFLSQNLTAECEITSFPVEKQSDLNDNIRLLPIIITVTGIVSNSPLDIRKRYTNFGADRARKAFDELLKLRDNKTKLQLLFYNRAFPDMTMQSLEVPNDYSIGNALIFTATFKQVKTIDLYYQEKYTDQSLNDRMTPDFNAGYRGLS